MAAITPTKTGVRWGPERWHLYDYWAHPTRDVGGNPVLIWRHGGSATTGHYQESWLGLDSSGAPYLPWNLFFEYLHSTSRDVHFDIISMESGQRGFSQSVSPFGTTLNIKATKRMYVPEGIQDFNRGVASIKSQGMTGVNYDTNYKLNPNLFITGGNSYGATVAGLASLVDPLTIGGSLQTPITSLAERASLDSKVLGVLYFRGQMDVRSIGGTEYQLYSGMHGYYGTYYNSATEWQALSNDIKASMSYRAYIQNGDVQNYVPMYVLYIELGNHVLPLTDAHDSRQYSDLIAALTKANLPYASSLITSAVAGDNSAWTTRHTVKVYSWMADLVRQKLSPKPAIPGNP